MFKKFRNCIILIFCLSFALIDNNLFANSEEQNAEHFIQNVGDHVLSILKDQSSSHENKENALTELFVQNVDVDWIARFAIGRYWKQATDDQKKEYIRLYRKYLINIYIPKFQEFQNQTFTVNGSKKVKDNTYSVQTEIITTGKPPVEVDYMIKWNEKSNSFKVYDIFAEGISLIAAHRSEFSTVASQEGVAGLIEKLKHVPATNK